MPVLEITPGGSSLNSCRAVNHILKEAKLCSFFGCVGKDQMGDLLEKLLTDLNIVPKLHKHETIPTGTCACIIV